MFGNGGWKIETDNPSGCDPDIRIGGFDQLAGGSDKSVQQTALEYHQANGKRDSQDGDRKPHAIVKQVVAGQSHCPDIRRRSPSMRGNKQRHRGTPRMRYSVSVFSSFRRATSTRMPAPRSRGPSAAYG